MDNSVDLYTVPPEYHEFTDVFSKAKDKPLALYHLYNLQIKLKNRVKPFIGTLYSLSIVEQEVLKDFISKSLNTSFIYHIFFSHKVFVLFKKMAYFTSMLTYENSTVSYIKTDIHFY